MSNSEDYRHKFLKEVQAELAKKGVKSYWSIRGEETATQERILHLDSSGSDEKSCVAAAYIMAEPASKIYFGWRANPKRFPRGSSFAPAAHSFSNGERVRALALKKFSQGVHVDRGCWILHKCIDKETSSQLATSLIEIS
jgi:hypothetical protein